MRKARQTEKNIFRKTASVKGKVKKNRENGQSKRSRDNDEARERTTSSTAAERGGGRLAGVIKKDKLGQEIDRGAEDNLPLKRKEDKTRFKGKKKPLER